MSVWTNLNQCFSYTELYGTSIKALCAKDCSEIHIFNNTPGTLTIYDSPATVGASPQTLSAANSTFVLAPSSNFILRGVTNSSTVSAITTVTGYISYRTHYFAMLPLNVY